MFFFSISICWEITEMIIKLSKKAIMQIVFNVVVVLWLLYLTNKLDEVINIVNYHADVLDELIDTVNHNADVLKELLDLLKNL